MKIDKKDIVIIIPSYNEASRIGETIANIYKAGYDEIILVDDGSSDGTEAVIREKFPDFRHFLRHCINRWYGAALETGFEYVRRNRAKYNWKYCVTFDADGQLAITNLTRFIHAFEQDPTLHIVMWSRFLEDSHANIPFLRKMILTGGKIFTRMISDIDLTDTHNGFRMIRTEVLDMIRTTMDGMEFSSELIDIISDKKLHWKEVPIDVTYDEYSLSKGQRYGWAFRIATRMIWRKFF